MYFLPVHKDLALGGREHAEQHFHQRGFSRAVLPHKRMDFALSDLKVYVVVRHNAAGIHLRDIPCFQDIPLLHNIFPFS